MSWFSREVIGVELPHSVELAVVETEPDLKGYRRRRKQTCQIGNRVCCPGAFFINEGDILRIDTRTGEYLERV